MSESIRGQRWIHRTYYLIFGVAGLLLLFYYLSNTLIYFTTPRQFPINSFIRFPLTFIIFPAELFSICFGLYFVYSLFTDTNKKSKPQPLGSEPPVAILLPVYNEPKDIVERTIKACTKLKWKKFNIYLLDDSTTKKDVESMKALAKKYKCEHIQRSDREGYKAGNINNAIKNYVKEEYFCVFDADQAPDPDFLQETMDHFNEENVGFVQTPQHFINNEQPIERAASIGTSIFYHTMCVSKANDNAMTFCGTNVITRRKAFMAVNGFSYYSSTEDIELGIRMNDIGYHGAYVPKILARGYAPQDFIAYATQQYRWANGNLAILRERWSHILFGPFSLKQQMHFIFTLGWWVIGLVSLAYITVPILSFFFGGTHHTWLPTALLVWIFFHVMLGIGIIFVSLHNRTSDKITLWDAFLEYSLITNSMFIYAQASIYALFKRYVGFKRTSKERSNSSIWHVRYNLLLSVICFGFSAYALFMAATSSTFQDVRTFFPVSLWLLFYCFVLASSVLFVGEANA